MPVTAIVMIKAHTASVSELAAQLVEIDGVAEVFSVAGRYDLIAIARARDNEELASVVSDRIRRLAGIADSETFIAFRTYSGRELSTAYSLGLD